MQESTLLIACGALARELVEIRRLNGWRHIRIQCLPAELHNRPEKIPGAVRAEIEKHRSGFESIFVAYADCGTGGMLDKVLAELGVERLPGAHCYEFFSGTRVFADLADEEPGTFYLTDFLARHFDRLVKVGLGLDKHPELKPEYFRNYRRLVYLSQSKSAELEAAAKSHADFLGLEYIHKHTGLEPVTRNLKEQPVLWRN
ncbi:MAG: DUF1638 domain-containing protein [Gammaproteobacteria bacterium]|nr:DUF1638 domain-containing protein [Gammaproteobacteria bacterium]